MLSIVIISLFQNGGNKTSEGTSWYSPGGISTNKFGGAEWSAFPYFNFSEFKKAFGPVQMGFS